jgi:16S rRNA U1498 N3-methylase RsmE
MDNIQELSVGQRIRARNSNGEWADAIIVSIDESKYAIKWHETNTQEEVAPDAINNGRYLRIDSKL